MNKKLLSFFLAFTVAAQLAFPVYGILSSTAEKRKIEQNGEIFRLSLTYLEYYNGICQYDIPAYGGEEGKYAAVSTVQNGIAVLKTYAVKPTGSSYIEAEKKNSYYEFPRQYMKYGKYDNFIMAEFTTANGMGTVFDYGKELTIGADEIIAEVKIYNGKVITKEIYIDSVPLSDVLEYLDSIYTDELTNG